MYSIVFFFCIYVVPSVKEVEFGKFYYRQFCVYTHARARCVCVCVTKQFWAFSGRASFASKNPRFRFDPQIRSRRKLISLREIHDNAISFLYLAQSQFPILFETLQDDPSPRRFYVTRRWNTPNSPRRVFDRLEGSVRSRFEGDIEGSSGAFRDSQNKSELSSGTVARCSASESLSANVSFLWSNSTSLFRKTIHGLYSAKHLS